MSEGAWEKLAQVTVKGAEHDSRERLPHPQCLEGTRVVLLNHIYGVLDDKSKNRLIWLHGTAGVGKSAVAFTVAERMRCLKVTEETNVEKRLAGTFFFSRKHTNRRTTGRLFATLAYQLASNFPSVKTHVNKTILENPALLHPDGSLRNQMEALFARPLRQLKSRLRDCPPLAFVIDALDECTESLDQSAPEFLGQSTVEPFDENKSEIEHAELISLLAQALRDPDLPVTHILVTSRSELHIHEAMQHEDVRPLVCEIPVKISGQGVAATISLDGADVDEDIYLFLQHSFRKLRSRSPTFPQPTKVQLERLANRAGRRFIVASTMMKFIDDKYNDPYDRLELMLELASDLLPGTEVYKLYDRILSTCADPTQAYLYLSVVTALADPLPMSQISKLLGPGQGRDVERVLVQLRSIIEVPTDNSLSVNIYHSSVRDYVSHRSNCSLPQVKYTTSPHSLLALSSLRLMVQEIPESTALLDALSELNKQSQAIKSHDPQSLKHLSSFMVQPPEPLQVFIGLLWLQGHRSLDLQLWLETLDGRAWLQTAGVKDWLLTQGGQDWLLTDGGTQWLLTQWGKAWLQSRGWRVWLHTKGGQYWLQTLHGRDWLQTQDRRTEITLVWLQTQAGEDWLRTTRGEEWLQSPRGRAWLQSPHGRAWLQIRDVDKWLQTVDTEYGLHALGAGYRLQASDMSAWLQTQGWLQINTDKPDILDETSNPPQAPSGQHQPLDWDLDCLQTQGEWQGLPQPSGRRVGLGGGWRVDWLWQNPDGWHWLQTPGGQEWLQHQGGSDWLQSTSWLQSTGGRNWLQNSGGRDWLQTQGGRDWLQTHGGRDWLQTQDGRDWLQTQGGRDWLQTQDVRDWLQTQDGRDWLQTSHGKAWRLTTIWVTMEEFSSTLEAIKEYIVIAASPSQSALQVIQQLKILPDFLMFPVFLALRHPDHATFAIPQHHVLPDMEIIHAIMVFLNFAYESWKRNSSASEALKYACQNWVVHLSRAPNLWSESLTHAFKAFWNHSLLSWLERQWCLKDLQSCLAILLEGEKIAKDALPSVGIQSYALAILLRSKKSLSEAFCGGIVPSNARIPTSTTTSLNGHRVSRSARNLSFLGIRNYFNDLERHVKKHNHEPLVVRRAQLSVSCPSRGSAQVLLQKPKESNIPIEDYYSGNNAPLPPSQRSDWRLRATSRTNRTQLFDGQWHRRYIKRANPPHIQVQQGEPFFEEIQAYNKHFLSLLESEQAEDEAVLRERLSTWSLFRLQEEGYTITGLSAFWMGAPKFGRPVASFSLGPGVDLPEHRFENGTQVLVSRFDPLQEPPRRGSVLNRTASQLRIAFEEKFEIEDGCWRLDVGRSNIVFIRMREAISRFNQDPQALEDRTHLISSPDNQFILHGTHLRDILLRSFSPDRPSLHVPLQPPDEVEYVPRGRLEHDSREVREHGGAFKEDMHIQSWARRYSQVNPIAIDGDPVLEGLNATQIRAIAMMIGERISLVQGPPGTGKTKTIIEAVKLLKVYFEVHHPLLVCTYTNVAVDNLVEGFAAAGVKPLRVGFGAKIKSSLYEYTLDAKLEAHPLKLKVDQLLKDQENVERKLGALEHRIVAAEKSGSEKLGSMRTAFTVLERQVLALRAKLYALHQEMLNNITAAADVICTTCITSASAALNILDFPVVFLDEASMSTEPASLIPLMRGSQHVALIGDHKQLPPVITSREAQLNGLGISLFERLTEEGVVPSIMLDVQYRMHPSISRFPSLEFYDFALQDGTVDSAGNIHPMLLPPLSSHLEQNVLTGHRPSVVFIDHGGAETSKDRSRVNWNEAHIVCSIVEDLLLQNENLLGANIGVIAPYAAQISLLYRLLNTDAKYRKRFASTLGDHRMMQLSSIEVKTVDGFEGREKDVIIFSTVRNNTSGYIGFLADRRRLNVGLTRAKRGLFIVGSISTLKAGKMAKGWSGESPARVGKGAEAWRRYAKYLLEENMVLTLSGDRLRKVLYGHAPKATSS